MKTGTYVAGMVGAGIVGGIVGAWIFLTFFADDLRPEAPPPSVTVAESLFSQEEAAALRRLPKRLEEIEGGLEALRKERRAAPQGFPAGAVAPGTAAPAAPAAAPSPEEVLRKNETAAIATLRNLATCHAQFQTVGKVDCDNDGIGEFGTFQEMTGKLGVRKGCDGGSPNSTDGTDRGSPINPAILSASLANVDGEGRVQKNGYYFQIFLPDTANPAGWTHESPGGGFSGGTGRVWIDLSETTWCAYAWPVEPGKTGNRAFFTNQSADVCQTANDQRRHGGAESFDPSSAFRGAGITSQVAVGVAGNDGNVWKVSN